MTFDEYWRLLEQRNAKMKREGTMTIRVESFRASLQQAFNMGEEHARQRAAFGDFDAILARRRG